MGYGTISFVLPAESPVWLTIHDASGRGVRALERGARLGAGPQQIQWDGCDERGEALPGGIYFCWMKSQFGSEVVRIASVR